MKTHAMPTPPRRDPIAVLREIVRDAVGAHGGKVTAYAARLGIEQNLVRRLLKQPTVATSTVSKICEADPALVDELIVRLQQAPPEEARWQRILVGLREVLELHQAQELLRIMRSTHALGPDAISLALDGMAKDLQQARAHRAVATDHNCDRSVLTP